MIGTVTGKAKDTGKGLVNMETQGGVGYSINVAGMTKENILQKDVCTLFTHTVIRKDTIELFGFLKQEEYSSFLLLITVSGIGPKKALTILETIPTETLLLAIKKGDQETLESFSINKKQAQRIILDLQRKITISEDTNIANDVVAALIALGYDKREIMEAVRDTAAHDKTIEEQIQEALKTLRTKTKY